MPLAESLALTVNEAVPPSALVWSAGVVIVTGLLIVQVKVWLAA